MRDTSTDTNHLSLFVIHASDLLTDHESHGDGLSAYGFLRGLALRGHTVHVAATDTAIRETLPSNFIIHKISLRSKSGALARLEYAFKVRWLFESLRKSIRFDLVQQMVPVKAGLSLGMIGIREPIVLGTFTGRWAEESHDVEVDSVSLLSRAKSLVGSLIVLAQICFARAFLVTSPAAAEQLPLRHLVRNRIYEIHHGIDLAAFSPDLAEVADRAGAILFVAKLDVRKGIYTLLDAFELVHERFPEATLKIVGSGSIDVDVRNRISTLRSRAKIEMLGALPRNEVAHLFRSSAIYCAPAYGEPYSTSLIEAMASGTAVVITDSGGAPFMVPTTGGRCVRTRDAESLSAALSDLLEHPCETRKMGVDNSLFAQAHYSWDVVLEHLESVYRAILTDPPEHLDLTVKGSFGSHRTKPS